MIASGSLPRRDLTPWMERKWFFSCWSLLAAFGAYACMYGFRKPFTAGTYIDPISGGSFKSLLISSQVIGYTLSKFIGIRVISEMPPQRRAWALLSLVSVAELALVLFACTPPPWNCGWLFLNGLPLGMVFGLVLGFLEGRQLTEFFVAGLCASFILADGATKSVGAWLLAAGIPEAWMPCLAGALFLTPLLLFVWMLQQIPPPNAADHAERAPRTPMSRELRRQFIREHGLTISLILLGYLLVTILRSIRADFSPELWKALGTDTQPGLYTRSEIWVASGVLLANGAVALIRDNRRAWTTALFLSMFGFALTIVAVACLRQKWLQGFDFMVLLGVGLYLPYVAVHTTLFERLIALTQQRANVGFLMYLADASGYLGYVGVMLGKANLMKESDILPLYLQIVTGTAVLATCAFGAVHFTFPRRSSPIHRSS